jgi:hypothetical protein
MSSPAAKSASPGLASGPSLVLSRALQPSLESICVDEVDERPLAADLDDGKPLPIFGLEAWVAADVDLLERLAARCQDVPGFLAERAAGSVIEDDSRYG